MTALAASKPGLDVGIVTNNIEAMRAFYVGALGLEDVESMRIPWGTMHRLRFGVSWLKLVDPDASPATGVALGLDAASGIRYLTFEIDNVDEIWAQAVAAGAEIFHDLAPFGDRGITMGMLFDPDGNVVELLHRTQPV